MKIAFNVGEKTVEFRRNWFAGSAMFVVDGMKKPLSDPTDQLRLCQLPDHQ